MRLRRTSPTDKEREPEAAPEELAEKIEAGCLSPRMNPTGDAQKLARRISKLRENERRVLELATEGRSNEEITRALWITQQTVEAHLRYIFACLLEGKQAARRTSPQ
jgi:ATP/maltotriose-dependent transcriptional regulator MalT